MFKEVHSSMFTIDNNKENIKVHNRAFAAMEILRNSFKNYFTL